MSCSKYKKKSDKVRVGSIGQPGKFLRPSFNGRDNPKEMVTTLGWIAFSSAIVNLRKFDCGAERDKMINWGFVHNEGIDGNITKP